MKAAIGWRKVTNVLCKAFCQFFPERSSETPLKKNLLRWLFECTIASFAKYLWSSMDYSWYHSISCIELKHKTKHNHLFEQRIKSMKHYIHEDWWASQFSLYINYWKVNFLMNKLYIYETNLNLTHTWNNMRLKFHQK